MPDQSLASGTYEVLRNRLRESAADLRKRFERLNAARAEVFGNIESKLLSTAHVTTDHNCVPRDLMTIGDHVVLGYNVQFGLKTEIVPSDVLSIYRFDGEHTHDAALSLFIDDRLTRDFGELYRYYKNARFSRFFQSGPHRYLVFQVGKSSTDIKAFKFLANGPALTYVDNRSEAEVRVPNQHSFKWNRATRESHRPGIHPHISIEDKVFVECVGGDLTIKVEDNTSDGLGIYREPVENADQTLDDAEIYSAVLGNLIVLKVRPYLERDFRYLVFSIKKSEVKRIDSIGQSCVLLPDDHGIIFPTGFYLQTGDYKFFDHGLENLSYEKTIAAPNGEDFLYLFYRESAGTYLQLRYNLIRQEVESPIVCHGQATFEDGRMLIMRATETPQKHHALQLWQSPYTGPDFKPKIQSDSILFKIGNRDLVRGMAECQEILSLIDKDESYSDLYADLVKRTTDVLDAYFWLDREEAGGLAEPIQKIREASSAAVDEFEKVVRVRNESAVALTQAQAATSDLLKAIERARFEKVDDFVEKLAAIRSARGAALQLRERRYIDGDAVAVIEKQLAEAADRVGVRCVQFLLEPTSLASYRTRIDEVSATVPKIESSSTGKKTDTQLSEIATALELLIETVSQLKIEDLTQRTQIIDRIGDCLSQLNQVRSSVKAKVRDLTTNEFAADFLSQTKLLDQATSSSLETADTPEKVDAGLTRLLMQMEELEARYAESESLLESLSEKRAALCAVFEGARQRLVEARNRRADALVTAADRILTGIITRSQRMDSPAAIASFFASDLMVDKVRRIADQLRDLGDSVRMEDVLSRLKAISDDAVRLQRDRQDLLSDGNSLIKLGEHRFSVNQQPIELTTVVRHGKLNIHLTGTQFFQPISDPALDAASDLWEQNLPSESTRIYRSEYLAYRLLTENESTFLSQDPSQRVQTIRDAMQHRLDEGYARGVHDVDTSLILASIIEMKHSLGLTGFPAAIRATAWFLWSRCVAKSDRNALEKWISIQKQLHRVASKNTKATLSPDQTSFERIHQSITKAIDKHAIDLKSFGFHDSKEFENTIATMAQYLYHQIADLASQSQSGESKPKVSQKSHAEFKKLRQHFHPEQWASFKPMVDAYRDSPMDLWRIGSQIVQSYTPGPIALATGTDAATNPMLQPEAIAYGSAINASSPEVIWLVVEMLLSPNLEAGLAADPPFVRAESVRELSGIVGDHPLIKHGKLVIDYHEWMERLSRYESEVIPRFRALAIAKKTAVERADRELKSSEFKAKVLTSFVRNQLIDEVYLPRVGDNLAKQIGSSGDNKRTDRMGLLLLVSPPGYGKTTLMEYVANRLGLVFVKVNGPALGHDVKSLDPSQAPNAAAKEEVLRINMALEMGDNVMLYLDDIQHCDSELLQKFIPLCDATRRIEGVWNGQSKTYDLRGRKFCVVMAGNPYTETGHRFQIPDMLANRADVYNLGEIIGVSQEAFEWSYLENCLTSNSVLQPLSRASNSDQRALIGAAIRGGQPDGITVESNLSVDQVTEILAVLTKLVKVRDIVLAVNREYIKSAAQSDDYRTEPPFKLQGSYRNMNRIAEKVVPVMNDAELQSLIVSSYQQDSQTLSRDGESNMLKFAELLGTMTEDQKTRWESIKYTFAERTRLRGLSGEDSTSQVLASLMGLRDGLESIRKAMSDFQSFQKSSQLEQLQAAQLEASKPEPTLPEQRVIVQHSVPRVMTELVRSQFQLLYEGLRPVLEQVAKQSNSNERLRNAIDDCLSRYKALEAEANQAEVSESTDATTNS